MKVTYEAARINAGLTQEQARKKIGCAKSTLMNWEKYRTDVPITAARKMADVYGCTLDDFLLPEKSIFNGRAKKEAAT